MTRSKDKVLLRAFLCVIGPYPFLCRRSLGRCKAACERKGRNRCKRVKILLDE